MLDPESLAREAVPGRGKPLVRLVARGPAHSVYRVMRDGRFFAMRLPQSPLEAGAEGMPSGWHLRVCAAAAAAGIGPAIGYADPTSGILVTEWVRGRTWTAASAKNPAQTARIGQLVQRIQALAVPPPHRVMGPLDWIQHYRDVPRTGRTALPSRQSEWPGKAEGHLAALQALPGQADVLCHSDLHRLNLIDSASGLIALDWEFAHFSDPYWDLAGWLCVNDLGAPDHGPLLEAYLGHPPEAAQRQRLQSLTWLYDYVCLLWIDATADPLVEGANARRVRTLAGRLSGLP